MKKLLLILAVLGLLVLAGCAKQEQGAAPAASGAPSAPESPAAEQQTGTEETGAASAATSAKDVTEEYQCGTGAAIGYKACSLLENGDISVDIVHNGLDTLAGAKYFLYDENNEQLAASTIMGEVKGGEATAYTIPFSSNKDAKKVEIRAIVNVDGADKVCLNQRVIVPTTSCR